MSRSFLYLAYFGIIFLSACQPSVELDIKLPANYTATLIYQDNTTKRVTSFSVDGAVFWRGYLDKKRIILPFEDINDVKILDTAIETKKRYLNCLVLLNDGSQHLVSLAKNSKLSGLENSGRVNIELAELLYIKFNH